MDTITIFGIDPGTRVLGFGWIEVDAMNLEIIVSRGCGVIEPKAPSAASKLSVPQRLATILADLEAIFAERRPSVVVIEKVFLAKNVEAAFVLGQARGVALAVASSFGAVIREEAAKTAKKSVTGRGSAEKTDVRQTLGWLLGMSEELASLPLDASDGLALAYQGWRSLIRENSLTTAQSAHEKRAGVRTRNKVGDVS